MEPKQHHNPKACIYCGDSPIPHRFSYFGTWLSIFFEPISVVTNKIVPKWMRFQAEKLLRLMLIGLTYIRFVTFSDDPSKATTFRSKVIWDEAIARGIPMRQLKVFGMLTDNYEAVLNGRRIFFDSLPIPHKLIDFDHPWDDKFYLKQKLIKENIAAPRCVEVPFFWYDSKKIFDALTKPVIVKPRSGSRGRHTTTDIYTIDELDQAISLAKKISPQVVVEEHLEGYICRATCIGGTLVGFYRADAPYIVGDGIKNVRELIEYKNQTRPEKVGEVFVNKEIENFLARHNLNMQSVIPNGKKVKLTHRTGRLFGGETREMLPELHPSFVPIIEKAAHMTGLPVAGFDVIVPNPEESASSQKWGIIECNTLPFIDLHYFALYGKPSKNIAGYIWDLWKKV